MSVHNIQESNALLLYRVGPVFVCSPTMPVEAVTLPPKLTVPPGSSVAEPGVFKSIHGMVRLVDLRVRFGVDKADRNDPGKIVIVEVEGGHAGFWVDEIEDVISFPTKGWSQVPAYIPRNVFSRTLVEEKNIRLYADFEQLDKFKSTGYLRKHIEMIKVAANKQANNKNTSTNSHNETNNQIIEEKTADIITTAYINSANKPAEEHIEISDVKSNDESSVKVVSLDKKEVESRDTNITQPVGVEVEKTNDISDNKNIKNLYVNKPDKTEQISKKESSYQPENRASERKPEINNIYSGKAEDNKLYQHQVPVSKTNKNINAVENNKSNNNKTKIQTAAKEVIQKNSDVKQYNEIKPAQPGPTQIQPLPQGNNGIIWFGLLALMAVVGVYYLFDFIEPGNDGVLQVDKKTTITETFKYSESSDYTEVKKPARAEKENMAIEPVVENSDVEAGSANQETIVDNESVEITKNDDGLLIVVNDVVQEDELIENSVEVNDFDADFNEQKDVDLENNVINSVSEKEVSVTPGEREADQYIIEEAGVEKVDELNISDQAVIAESKKVIERQVVTESKDKIESQTVIESEPVNVLKADNSSTGLVSKERKEVADKTTEVELKNTKKSTLISSKKFIHVVVKGDTLWFIAKRYVHNPWRYPELAKLSNIKNPDLIYPGDHVTVIINYKRSNN
ncbi:MAG: LysM peptidoglycan-binding domain-containing protein [Gammaproteobacteria bacterium]|nr:LysM peptidoglycan-binding domain-containing protein [Gammaproteobacteria bacterium]